MAAHQYIAWRHHRDVAQVAPVHPAIFIGARHALAVDFHQRLKAGVAAGNRRHALGHRHGFAQLIGQCRLERRFVKAEHHPCFGQLVAGSIHRNRRATVRWGHLQLRHQAVGRHIHPIFGIAALGNGGDKGLVFANVLSRHGQGVFVEIQLAIALLDGHVAQGRGINLEAEVVWLEHQAQFTRFGFRHGQAERRLIHFFFVFTHCAQSSLGRPENGIIIAIPDRAGKSVRYFY